MGIEGSAFTPGQEKSAQSRKPTQDRVDGITSAQRRGVPARPTTHEKQTIAWQIIEQEVDSFPQPALKLGTGSASAR